MWPRALVLLHLLLMLVLASSCSSQTMATTTPTTCPSNAAPVRDRSPLLGSIASEARRAGAGELIQLAQGMAGTGDRVAGFLALEPGGCALVFARGGPNVIDVDVHVYSDDGTQHGSDQEPDAEPSVLVCVPQATRLFVAARVAQGTGLVAVGGILTDAAAGGELQRSTNARAGRVSGDSPDRAWPELTEIVATRRDALGGEWVDQRRVAIPVDARVPSRLSATVSARSCLDVLVLTNESTMLLQLEVMNEAGRILERRLGSPKHVATTVCSESEEELQLSLRPQSGQGVALVVLSRSLERPVRLPRKTVETGEPSSPPKDAVLLANDLKLVRGRVTFHRVTGLGCAEYLLFADVPSPGQLRAWQLGGQALAEGARGSRNRTWVCHQGAFHLDLEAEWTGSSRLYRRTLTGAPASLVQRPRAASRLLNEATRRWGDLRTVPALLEGHDLAASELKSISLHSASLSESPPQCHLLVVATDLPTSVRIVKTGARWEESVAAAEGSGAVSLEVCGAEWPLPIELSVAQSTSALVGVFSSHSPSASSGALGESQSE